MAEIAAIERGSRYTAILMLPALFRTMRPHQWVKNLFVLAPLIFARELTTPAYALRAFAAFAVFCVLSSSVYVLNDLVDVEADREHPKKKHRPIASGKLSIEAARTGFVVLLSLAIGGGALLGYSFLFAAMAYLILNLAYSFALKKVAYLDVVALAGCYELRVLAGAFATDVPASEYLLVETFLLSSFLGLGKRAHELSNLSGGGTRAALRGYSPRALKVLLAVTGLATCVTYTVYTLDPHTIEMFHTPYLAVTSVFMFVGVGRFVQLVQSSDAESPTEAMLKDRIFVLTGILGAIVVLALIYASFFSA
ncbi:MAG: decaprenyl-phosphate phosphoribosyltransferase [Sandaracinus sp.]